MIDYNKKKEYLIKKQGYKCASCGLEFKGHDKIDLAHKVKASKFNYKRFGELVIDHTHNLAATHQGNCNDKQNRSRAAHPLEASALIEKIKADIIIE